MGSRKHRVISLAAGGESSRRTIRVRSAFTLIELLIVIAIMGILAALMTPSLNPSVQEQLRSTSQSIAADLSFARSLAVTNNTSYRLTWNVTGNSYTLQHVGSDSRYHALPASPFHPGAGGATAQTVTIHELPNVGKFVQLLGVVVESSPRVRTTVLEFGPLGETAAASETVVWLAAGAGYSQCYLPVRVNPVTGIVTVGELQTTPPTIPS